MNTRVLTLGSTNRHKAREIAAILAPAGYEIHVPDDLPDVEETGETFAENARLKARSAARHVGRPALADDSGIVVDALGGEPGVLSARYAGPGADARANNALLVARLQALGVVDAQAAFVCHAVLAAPDGTILAEAEGRVEGIIRWPARGEGGFGYDPLFHHPPSGCRMSELAPDQKNALSHRGEALRRLVQELAAVPDDAFARRRPRSG